MCTRIGPIRLPKFIVVRALTAMKGGASRAEAARPQAGNGSARSRRSPRVSARRRLPHKGTAMPTSGQSECVATVDEVTERVRLLVKNIVECLQLLFPTP